MLTVDLFKIWSFVGELLPLSLTYVHFIDSDKRLEISLNIEFVQKY